MSNDNPFGFPGGDRTVVAPAIPTPGGRPAADPAPQPHPPFTPTPPSDAYPPMGAPMIGDLGSLSYTGLNPLVKAANPLLVLGCQLRDLVSHADVSGLRHHVMNEIRIFESECQSLGIRQEIVHAARYVLCTFLDEMVLNTVWGSNSFWTQQSLLAALHNDTWGGERFFAMVDQLLKNPNGDPDLLELMLVCINLGFKGKFRMSDQGQNYLEQLSVAMFERIRNVKGREAEELSPRWFGGGSQARRLRRLIPLWVVFSIAGALLVTVFVGFNFVLEHTTSSTYQKLQNIAPSASPELSSREIE